MPATLDDIPAYVGHPKRVAAVHATGLVDTLDDECFDRFSRLAARLTGAPIARVSLVTDTKQYFKSAVGPAPASRETPLSHAICKHVVGSRQPLVVENCPADSRLAGNGAVCEDGVAAYAGEPLFDGDGECVGVFCVADKQPRPWTDEQRAALADLTAAVNTEILLRAALANARRANANLDRQARTDALTGLPNRRRLAADLGALFADGRPATLALYDLDGFKRFNDTEGHGAGDALLQRLGGRLAAAVQPHGSAYRLGGDEFCTLTPIEGDESLPTLAAAVDALTDHGPDWSISASMGACVLPVEASSSEGALGLADRRMYADKRARRCAR
jgi:diguanylate cyclase (GGDEF)-like protein